MDSIDDFSSSKSLSPSIQKQALHDPLYAKKYANDLASTSEVVFVQLPREVLQAPSQGGDHRCVLDGLRYIIACAGAQTKQIVAVVDYGSNLGAHNGSSIIERAMDDLVLQCKKRGITLKLVFPAGNSGSNRTSALATLNAQKKSADFALCLPLDCQTPTYAQVWINTNAANTAQLEITDPHGNGIKIKNWGNHAHTVNHKWHVFVRQFSDGLLCSLRLSPTSIGDKNPALASAGRYQINIKTTANISANQTITVNAYTCFGGENLGNPVRGKQSRWMAISDNVSVSRQDRVDTPSLIGTVCGKALYVVAAYQAKASQPWKRAVYSSIGGSRGARQGPDFAALSDDDAQGIGVLGLGTRSGHYARMWGTSVAAPQLARVLARKSMPVLRGLANAKEIGAGFVVDHDNL